MDFLNKQIAHWNFIAIELQYEIDKYEKPSVTSWLLVSPRKRSETINNCYKRLFKVKVIIHQLQSLRDDLIETNGWLVGKAIKYYQN